MYRRIVPGILKPRRGGGWKRGFKIVFPGFGFFVFYSTSAFFFISRGVPQNLGGEGGKKKKTWELGIWGTYRVRDRVFFFEGK